MIPHGRWDPIYKWKWKLITPINRGIGREKRPASEQTAHLPVGIIAPNIVALQELISKRSHLIESWERAVRPYTASAYVGSSQASHAARIVSYGNALPLPANL